MVVKNIIAEDMPFTKSIFEQFWRSYCKKTIFVVFHFLKFLPIYIILYYNSNQQPEFEQFLPIGWIAKVILSAGVWSCEEIEFLWCPGGE